MLSKASKLSDIFLYTASIIETNIILSYQYMQSLLEELHQTKDRKYIEQWVSRFVIELDRLDQG